MKVALLKEQIENFAKFLHKDKLHENAFLFEAAANFKANWDIDAPDLAKMYDNSLQCSQTKRLWKAEHWFPKDLMLKFIAIDPEFIRRMFKDLLNESKEIEGRISRFKFGLDEMLKDYKRKHKNSIENDHFHEDNKMIFLYLAFSFPEAYTLYDFHAFFKKMNDLGILNPVGPFDLDRFVKLTRAMRKFCAENQNLSKAMEKRLSSKAPSSQNMLIVYDFYKS